MSGTGREKTTGPTQAPGQKPEPKEARPGGEFRPRFGGRGHGPGRGIGMPFDKPKDFGGTLRRLMEYLKPHKLQLLAVIFMSIHRFWHCRPENHGKSHNCTV